MQSVMSIVFTVKPKLARYCMATNSRPIVRSPSFIVFGNTHFARRYYTPEQPFSLLCPYNRRLKTNCNWKIKKLSLDTLSLVGYNYFYVGYILFFRNVDRMNE